MGISSFTPNMHALQNCWNTMFARLSNVPPDNAMWSLIIQRLPLPVEEGPTLKGRVMTFYQRAKQDFESQRAMYLERFEALQQQEYVLNTWSEAASDMWSSNVQNGVQETENVRFYEQIGGFEDWIEAIQEEYATEFQKMTIDPKIQLLFYCIKAAHESLPKEVSSFSQ